MKALILPCVPVDMERKKDQDPQITVTGGGVYLGSVVKALDRYGTYDRYYLLKRADASPGAAAFSFSQRVCCTSLEALPNFCGSDSVVFFAGDPAIHILSPWRRGLNLPRAPITGIVHSMDNEFFFLLLMRHLLTGEMRRHDALICSSRAGKAVVQNAVSRIQLQFKRISGVSPEFQPRLPVIPLGVWASQFSSFSRDAARAAFNFAPESVVFLYVGRFSTLSKADLAPVVLAFCLEVAPRYPHARLVLAGDDTASSLAADLRLLARELGHADRVLVFPNISTAIKIHLYASADVFVSPSDNIQETFGITLVEAMAAGLPVIASDWNGYKDIVLHGHTGFLVPTYMTHIDSPMPSVGSPSQLSASLAASTVVDMELWVRSACELAGNAELRRRMGAAGRSLVDQKYDWAAVIRNYEELWDELFAESGKIQGRALPVDFDEVSFASAFAHYPTGTIATQTLQVNAAAASLMHSPEIKRRLLQSPSMFQEDIFTTVLNTLQQFTRSTADELVAAISQDHKLPATYVRTHVARLLKFGLLTMRQE